MTTKNDVSLDELFALSKQRLEKIYNYYLDKVPAPDLRAAMEHSLFSNGKQLRPLLVYATGRIFNTPWEHLDIPAAAIEMIHTYSLIHDDLPCMDDADLRRGKPSCHKAFSEAMAVLAGDALLTLALQITCSPNAGIKPEQRILMVKTLTEASGPYGMVAGQVFDIVDMQASLPINLLDNIYRLKTGALFSACIELGRLASQDDDEINQRALRHFGDCIGLAFQIQDDILDIETETNLLGKTQGIDNKNQKSTYPSVYGLAESKDKVQALYQDALESINYLGHKANLLRELLAHMLERKK